MKILNKDLLREKIIGPLPLGNFFPDLTKRGLYCVTELHSRVEIDRLVAATKRALELPI